MQKQNDDEQNEKMLEVGIQRKCVKGTRKAENAEPT
jgi:hypothetical protein